MNQMHEEELKDPRTEAMTPINAQGPLKHDTGFLGKQTIIFQFNRPTLQIFEESSTVMIIRMLFFGDRPTYGDPATL